MNTQLATTITKRIMLVLLALVCVASTLSVAEAGEEPNADISILEGEVSTTSLEEAQRMTASSAAASILNQRPQVSEETAEEEDEAQQAAILALFQDRLVTDLSWYNIMGYWVQQVALLGIPANTIVLILLTPILATIICFIRVIVGLPTLELLVPIALAFALVSVGVTLGLIILGAVLIATYVSRWMLKRVRMMFFPKRSLSMLLLALFVFAALTVAVYFDIEGVRTLSIFPVLILMLLGDSIVSIQLRKSFSETFVITGMTILIGLIGFIMATNVSIQFMILLYPELVLLTIPLNLMIGRYFGLRVSELFRFKSLQ